MGVADAERLDMKVPSKLSTWVDALVRSPLKPYLERTFWVVGEGPGYGDRSVRGMRELLERLRRYPPGPKIVEGDPFLRLGYAAAQVTTAVLERAVENRDLSSDGILRAITQLGTVSFGGLFGDYRYGPVDRREPPRVSTIFKVNADKHYGLEALETNFSSAAAGKYRFPGG